MNGARSPAAARLLTAGAIREHCAEIATWVTGVARDEVNNRLTPVALAVPAPLVVDFHLQWRARAEQSFDRPLLRAVGG